jgi:4-hydroxy-tetrahydrodipicolinate reductase
MTGIIMSGCFGHMGTVITELVSGRSDCKIVAGVDINIKENPGFPVYTKISDVKEEADVVIDFSHPSLLNDLLNYSTNGNKTPLVLCTTGYTPEQVENLKKASETVPIFYSRNMSLGINLIVELAKKATKVLGSQFDVEIIEKHHNQKIDAPSGTALMIADAISSVREDEVHYMYDRHSQRKKRDSNEIGIHAVRGGTIVGEHEVIFAGKHEVITLSHSAQSKELFATGAVSAAVYMNGKSAGLYDMSDLI